MKVVKSKQTYSGGSCEITYHKERDKGCWHREDGPAVINYNKDGSIFSESWWVDDKRHREGAPAIIYYRKDGSISSESWWINGKRHRKDGPAAIDYNKDGGIRREYWYINGKKLSENQINDIKRNLAFNRWLEQELDHENS